MDKHLICIAPINWNDVWEGPQEISCGFAAAGWRVLFVENLGGRIPRPTWQDGKRILERLMRLALPAKTVMPRNITVHTPFNLPPYTIRWVENRNLRALTRQLGDHLRKAGGALPVIWTYHPSGLVLKLRDALHAKLLIYCCIIDYDHVCSGNFTVEDENEMVRAADLVFVVPRQVLAAKRRINSNSYSLPQGGNVRDYLAYTPDHDDQTELHHMPHPLIGYVGTIHEWLDQDLLRYAAQNRPHWRFVLIGPSRVNTRKLRGLSNLTIMGFKPHSLLPPYVSQFDVGIIPYLTTGQGRSLRPNKALEYLMMGKPVVASDLPELADLAPHVLVAKSGQQFVEAIDHALTLTSLVDQQKRKELALSQSLDQKFADVEQLVLKHLSQPAVNR